MAYQLDFNTSYCQFYICDKESPRNTGDNDFWSKSAFDDRLAIGDGILGVGIGSYGRVRGELNLLAREDRDVKFDDYDHIVEASLQIISDVLQVLECPNSFIELEVNINPGIYNVRVYSWGLENADRDEDECSDRYRIDIWPGDEVERKVLKRSIY